MRTPPQLTLPGLIALIVVAGLLMYFEKSGSGGPSAPSPTASARVNGDAPGAFDYYSLVLSWSPTHCESPEGRDDDAQCAPRNGRRYAFILHGLWPQHERGYPESCPAETTWVPQPVIDGMLDVMPGKGLIIHEYRKHGTCSGLSPSAYYRVARTLYDSIRIPDRFRGPTNAQFLDPDDVVREFVTANAQLKPDMIAVACRGPGSRLREVRICFSKSGAPRSCGDNEDQRQLCRGSRVHVPPVR
ncbi:ribonuclease T [uncultured Hyphomicrobium sp.]|uniref:ribonuclease T2 family protein n=1 Tax=uncultured Hyphomicrobium sp. TaxID=194373 RepID=UPI0025FFA617|nr:ribonuclease T [uncultured Hyphomicrobium sp.]